MENCFLENYSKYFDYAPSESQMNNQLPFGLLVESGFEVPISPRVYPLG